MKQTLSFLVLAVSLCPTLKCQVDPGQPIARPRSSAQTDDERRWSRLEELRVWPYIGAPPMKDAPQERLNHWRAELQFFISVFDTIKSSWNPSADLDDVRSVAVQVERYEQMFHKVSESKGYGNVVLADCLRRLSMSVLLRFIVQHPSQYQAASAMVSGRSLLIESRAFQDMIAGELGGAMPGGGVWELADDKVQLDTIFRAVGTTTTEALRRFLLKPVGSRNLMEGRDIGGLLSRALDSDAVGRVGLPGLLRFLGRGGRFSDLDLADVRPFLRLMEADRYDLRFTALGINAVTCDQVFILVEAFGPTANRLGVATLERRASGTFSGACPQAEAGWSPGKTGIWSYPWVFNSKL